MTALIEASSPHVMNTYGRLPIAMSHGQGAWVWDVNGRKYLDGLAGIAVNTLGHNHPKLVPALQDQIAKLIHCCNYYHVPGQEALATKLVEFSGMSNVFFCSTGLSSWSTRRPSTAARSPPCRPPATRRSSKASAPWSKASCGCR